MPDYLPTVPRLALICRDGPHLPALRPGRLRPAAAEGVGGMTDASHVIPPDGTCAVGSCYAPRAHDGTHFCVMHQAREGA